MNTFGRKSIERILECPVCFDTIKQPKVLLCQHSFCFHCVYRLYSDQAAAAKANKALLVCPICKNVTPLAPPKEKVKRALSQSQLGAVIPNNFTLIALLDVHARRPPPPVSSSEAPSLPSNKPSVSDEDSSCGQCSENASWYCCACGLRLCASCLPPHLDLPGDHPTFDLEEQNRSMEAVKRASQAGTSAEDLSQNEPSSPLIEEPPPKEVQDEPPRAPIVIAVGSDNEEEEEEDAEEDEVQTATASFSPLSSASSASASPPLSNRPNPSAPPQPQPRGQSASPLGPGPAWLVLKATLSDSVLSAPPALSSTPSPPANSPDSEPEELHSDEEEEEALSAPTPPPVPPPRRPNKTGKTLAYPQIPRGVEVLVPGGSEALTPSKIAVDCQGCLFVAYEQDNCGIHKFSRDGGRSLRFANVGRIRDFTLDRKNGRLFVTTGPSLLCYSSETGQLLHNLSQSGLSPVLLAICRPRFDALFLLDQSSDSVRLLSLQRPTKPQLTTNTGELRMSGASVVAMESQPLTGTLFLISRQGATTLLFSFTKDLGALALIPVLTGLLRNPRSLAVDKNHLYLADPEARRLLVLTSLGVEVRASEESVCQEGTFSWEPSGVCLGVDGATYFADRRSKALLKHQS